MSNNWMRRCLAASALALVIGPNSPIASAQDSPDSYIEFALDNVLDLDPASDSFMTPIVGDNYRGLPFGTELNIEWWEWADDADVPSRNPGCTFTVSVDESGTFHSSANVGYSTTTDGYHNFRLSEGCSPVRVGRSDSYLRIYPTQAGETPVLVRTVAVNSGTHLNTVGPFRHAPTANRGSDKPWSLSDDCAISALATDYNQNINDHEGIEFQALNANINPEIIEDDEDVSSDGGLVIFTERDDDGDEGAWVICDAGYIPGTAAYFPDQGATYSLERTIPFDILPNTAAGTYNEEGQGLRNAGLRDGNLAAAFADQDVLSVVSYNTTAIPGFPENSSDGANCVTATSIGKYEGKYCNLEKGKRKKIVKEIAESVVEARPDVIVMQEVYQDGLSGFGTNNWNGDREVREELKDALEDLYTFASFSPGSWPGDNGNPLECPGSASNTLLTKDTAIYPDQIDADMIHNDYCSDPSGAAIDSGLFVGVLRSAASIVDQGFHRYQHATDPDSGSSKGIKHVKIRKGLQDYHIFTSHMQSSINDCAARVGQFREAAQFIVQQTGADSDSNVRAVLTGDLNTGPVRNNHVRREPDTLGANCRNEFEYLIQKLRSHVVTLQDRDTVGRLFLSPNSLPFSNDCLLNELVDIEKCGSVTAPGDKSKVLDHAVWVGQKPTRSGAVFYRQNADGENNGFGPGEDYSGHYPLLSVMDFRTSVADQSLQAFYDYGSSGLAGFDLDRPTMCPYGTIVEYNPDGVDFGANPGAEPDLLCLPLSCRGNLSPVPGDVCNASELALSNHESRRMCRDLVNEENFAAPCIIPAGYENLARQADVVITSSGENESSELADDWIDDNVVDGRIVNWNSDTDRQIAWRTKKNPSNQHWVKLAWPTPQYVKRIRMRTGSTDWTNNWGTERFALFYNDTADEYAGCPVSSDYEFHRDMTMPCTKVFGDVQNRDAITRPENDGKSNPDLWNIVELDRPVLTDQIVFVCVKEFSKGCSIAEIEVYGGAE